MPNKKPPKSKQTTNVVGAGAAGGGIGTLIATFAESLPADSSYKSFLTIAAPLIAIGISGVWFFIKSVYIDPYAAKKKHDADFGYLNQLIDDAKSYEKRILDDPNSTEKHKQEVRKNVENIEKKLMQAIEANVELVIN